MFPVNSSYLNFIQTASSTPSLISKGAICTIASLYLWQHPFNLRECPTHHSGWAWRVCWQKERQDRKGLIIVVLAPAEGKTRLERFNYSCTAPEGSTPHKKTIHVLEYHRMYVRWWKERQDRKGVITVVLLRWGRLPTENSTHVGVSSDVRGGRKNETERVKS